MEYNHSEAVIVAVVIIGLNQIFCFEEYLFISQNHRVGEKLSLEETWVGHFVQPPLIKKGHVEQIVQDRI